jgi:hypothetical protein
MAVDNAPEQWLEACTAYQRDVALAQIDLPPGEPREARLAAARERCAAVCSASALVGLRSQIAEAPAAWQETLQRLRAWGLTVYMQGALQPQQREIQARQRSAMCVVDEESIPLLASFAAMASETRRDRRAAIESAVGEQLGTLNELFEAQFETLRRVVTDLEYPSFEALWHDVTPVEAAAQEDLATRILETTQEVYTDLLHWAVRRRLGIPPGQLRRHDILALFTFAEYQHYYQPDAVVAALRTCLPAMGVDPRVDGRLVLRPRPAAFGPPAALPLHIPDEVVLSYGPVSGLQGAEAYASAYGRALLWAYTSEALPVVKRVLGEAAIATGNAQFLAEMVALPGWLRHYLRVSVDSNYASWRRLDRLYRLRRQLGRFLYTRHLYTTASLAGAPEAYREIMMNACQVDYPAAYYLTDWDWQYSSLAFLRGWALAYALLEIVQQRFAGDWFRNPDAGAWLCTYWHGALGERLEDLLQHLHGVAWDAALFAEVLINEALW